MKVYIVSWFNDGLFERSEDYIEKVFLSREKAEQYVEQKIKDFEFEVEEILTYPNKDKDWYLTNDNAIYVTEREAE